MTVLHGVQLALISAFLTTVIDASIPPEHTSLPPGYYAFETGGRRHGTPPRVRPPPYIPTDVPCPGVNHNTFMYSPRDTLCGDLNKAFIPRNPMGQHPLNQPYPFEIIKNKTLHFLARALPFLKDDMDSIPKVVKLTKRDPSLEPPLPPPPPASTHYDFIQAVRKKRSTTAEGSSPVVSTSSSSSTPVEERSPRGSTSSSTKSAAASLLSGLAGGVGGGGGLFGSSNWNLSEARQKACEHKDGIMCQLVNGLSGNNLLTQAVQVISAAQTAANTAQSIGSLASLLHHFSSASSSSSPSSAPGEQPSKSLMSQIAAALSAEDLSPPPSSPPSSTSSSSLSGSSNFNPVLAVLDYLASNSNEKSAVSSLLPARRKKPMDLEELASEAAAAVSVTNKVPPTPCPSLEEYIAPVFARNYQGVWKYIVQIPHEGYFTQTVQKTSCVKTKCDFMDGSCHESPRWVSLLVAEIFYPDARFPQPVPMPAPASRYDAPQVYHYHQQNTMMHQPLHQQQQVFVGPRPEVKRQPAIVPQQPRPQWRAVDPPTAPASQISSTPVVSQVSPAQPQPSPTTPVNSSGARRMKRQSGVTGEDDSNDVDKKPMDEKECDGIDKIGCFTVRVYYDWFLVPGSCKCWKKTSQGSLDALKKIFIGK